MKLYCRDKTNCGNKKICFDCKIKIYNEMLYEFCDLNSLNIFLQNNNCTIIENYENKVKSKFIKFIYKEFEFVFYECQQCFKWYRVEDHPFRLSIEIKKNDNLKPTCSKRCMYLHRPKEAYKNNGPKIKFCDKCNKQTLHNGNICCICKPEADQHKNINYSKLIENNLKPGNCTSCGIFNNQRSASGLGKDRCNCFNTNMILMHKSEKHYKHICLNCGNEQITKGLNWICNKCGDSYLMNFNRSEFYREKLNIISFNSLEQEVKLQDFDSLKSKIGVWSRWTDKNHGNYCLDVCKTKDIGGEMLSSLRSFNSLAKNPCQELDIGWKKKYFNQAKDAGLFDNSGKIIFKLIALCKTEEEALKIEQQYAHDNKAKYWSLGPNDYNIPVLMNPNL